MAISKLVVADQNKNVEFDESIFEKAFEKVIIRQKKDENSVTKSQVVSIICMLMTPNPASYKMDTNRQTGVKGRPRQRSEKSNTIDDQKSIA